MEEDKLQKTSVPALPLNYASLILHHTYNECHEKIEQA